ncbi:hypothetical protein NP233_g7467 [Leucocoprinus birnbaumii]|uniref:Uncharacterized protein n=1 Tax=Leucocoprinus birnbaumii TaxID=56174 RepID=A0AAD5VP54_9AGAR|nr:hypothetical protein NP233_g7467 [Leucocoprinus birnbaumii]
MEKGAPAAIHNSAYRAYPPRCHEETRQSMRTDIGPWTADPKRLRRMRWYVGPAGVGKSAVAQSAAEELDLLERLGATSYFSCPGKIDDPDTVIPTPASQLATKNTRYKHLITLALGNDPLILSLAFIHLFINDDDGDNDDPSARFGLCARVIRGVGIGAETANPLELLDSLHRQVLSRLGLESSIRLYHASFSDFLREPARSRDFSLDEGVVHYDVTDRSLSWLEKVRAGKVPDSALGPTIITRKYVWDACRKVSGTLVPDLIIALEQFDFGAFEHS